MVFLIGIGGILITVLLHAVLITALIGLLKKDEGRLLVHQGTLRRSLVLATIACVLALKHTIDAAIWAAGFWIFANEQLPDFEQAFYLSSVTYTSLGYGDVVLTGRWRLLCSFEATSGLLLFGLSTASLFALVQRLWIDPSNH